MESRVVSVAGYVVMVAGLLGLILTRSLLAPHAVVVLVQVGAVGVMIWARITFGVRSFHLAADPTAGGLVTSGPYRYLRHPIYAAVCWFVWAGALGNLSPVSLACALVVTVGAVIRLLCEERLLVERYPEYRDYAARTPRLIPFLF
jgi:protein-S-isoprenylcysteine O-methyltransferase Ste14